MSTTMMAVEMRKELVRERDEIESRLMELTWPGMYREERDASERAEEIDRLLLGGE